MEYWSSTQENGFLLSVVASLIGKEISEFYISGGKSRSALGGMI